MSVKSLLCSSLRLAVGAFLLPACAPTGASRVSTHVWPAHGNQYYNYWDAKYLGSDCAATISYRLIDSQTYNDIWRSYNGAFDDANAIRSLVESSHLIRIDSNGIQADLQWVRDSTVITGREYQVYLFIDRTTGVISSLHGDPGTDHDSHPYVETDRNHGIVSPIPIDRPCSRNRILIGQVHGHPGRPDGITLHRMSPDDSLTAVCLQAPIYAIDAMDGSEGSPGPIHRANPDAGGDFNGQDHYIGKTRGMPGRETDSVFNIGLNALHIWGISRSPEFDLLKKIDLSAKPGHHPDSDLDRGLVNIESRSVHP